MSPPAQSDIWNYFKLNEHDRDKADCKLCNKTYSRKGRTTSSLKNHLKSMHSEQLSLNESSTKEIQLQEENTDAERVLTPLQELKRQLFLEEVLVKEEKWDADNYNSERIDKLIGEMIALQNLPFNFVEGQGFRRLIKELSPQYNLRGRNFFTDFVCKDLYSKVAEKVRELIEKFNYLSFTSDIWSDQSSNDSLLILTCYGIAENFDRSSIILKCVTFDRRHTGDIIAEKFNSMLSEWNIEKKRVHCLIRDEGVNMKTAERLAGLNDIDSTVHRMRLAVRCFLDSQESIKLVEQKCKIISTHFNHSTIAQKQLQAIQYRLHQPQPRVFQHCITRWNSTFYMFERFLKVKDALSLYINDSEIDPILPQEWKIIESCIELLIPFEEATRELSSSYALISSVIPIIQILNKKVEAYLASSEGFNPIRQAVRTLKTELTTEFSYLDNNLYVIATYLDPRYKHKFLTPVAEAKIKEDILMIARNTEFDGSDCFNFEGVKRMRMTVSSDNDSETQGPGTSSLNRRSCLKNDLAMMLDSSSEDESGNIAEDVTAETILKRELLSYRNKKRLNVDKNPLEWWSIHREELKLLSQIARRFLSTPPGTVRSEQSFSSAGLIYEPLRNKLDPEKAAILLFIKYNAPIFNFRY